MASKRDKHDHIRVKDESFRYLGKEAEELENVFITNRILLLQGCPFIGKTRTSKEVVLRAARIFRKQGNETHSFYLSIRTGFKVDDLEREVIDALRENIQGWSDVKIDSIHDLARCFRTIQNGKIRYIFALDDIDRLLHEERGNVLKFVEELVSGTDYVFMILASRFSMNLIKSTPDVKKHRHGPMSPMDAKALLKELSGNPPDLDQHADRIVELVCLSPFPIMMAGYQMNQRQFDLPFTPHEFVEVMENSVSRTLGLENTPTDDQIPERIKAIVTENYHVLEKIVSSVNDPESFEISDLYAAMNESQGCVKQLILHVVLKGSVYMVADNVGDGMHRGLQASPLVCAILKEFFCQMSSKDIFLNGFHEDIIKALDNQKDELLTSRAGALRHAEWHLLKKQRQGCSREECEILWRDIITIGGNLVQEVTGDETKARQFCTASTQKLMSLQSSKIASLTTQMHKMGSQESVHSPVLLPAKCSIDPHNFMQNGEKKITEPEACLSPDSSSSEHGRSRMQTAGQQRIHEGNLEEPPDDENKPNDKVQREIGSVTAGKTKNFGETCGHGPDKQDSNHPTNCEKQQSSNADASNADTTATPSFPSLPDVQSPVKETVRECQSVNASGHDKSKEISSQVGINSDAKKSHDEPVLASEEAAKGHQKATTAGGHNDIKAQALRDHPSEYGSVFRNSANVNDKKTLPNTDSQDQCKYASSRPSDIFLENRKESCNAPSSADSDSQSIGIPLSGFGSLHSTDQHYPLQDSTENAKSDKTYSALTTSPMTSNNAVCSDQKTEQSVDVHAVKHAEECLFDWKICENGHVDDLSVSPAVNGGLRKQSSSSDLHRQSPCFPDETLQHGHREFRYGTQASVESSRKVQYIGPSLMEHSRDPRCHGSIRHQIPQHGRDVPRLPLPSPIPSMTNPHSTQRAWGPPSQSSYCQYAYNMPQPLTTNGFQMPSQFGYEYGQQYPSTVDGHGQLIRGCCHQPLINQHNMQTIPMIPSAFYPPPQYIWHPPTPVHHQQYPGHPHWQDQANRQMSNHQTQAAYHQPQFSNLR